MGSLVRRLARGGVAAAALVVAGASGSACAFSLEDVVAATGDAGSRDDAAQPSDGGDLGSLDPDGAMEQDGAPSLTLLGRVCTRGRVASLAVNGSTLFAICSDGGWSFDGAPSGPVVRASAKAPFDSSTPIDITGSILAPGATDTYVAGSCGLARINAQGDVAPLTTVLPTAVTGLRIGATVVQFAGLEGDGISLYDIADGSCVGDGPTCTRDPGCTHAIAGTFGTSMGIAGNGTGRVDFQCASDSKRPSIIPFNNTVQPAIFTGDPGSCDGDVSLGVGATGSKIYFGLGSAVYSCKLANGGGCGVAMKEDAKVTLVTGNASANRIAWVAGDVVRRLDDNEGKTASLGQLPDRATALAFDGNDVLVGTLGGMVYRNP